MRKALVGSVAVVVAVLGCGAAYLVSMDVNQFRPRIQASLEKQLGRSVSLGPMALRLIPLSIKIDRVAIGEDPRFQTGRQFISSDLVSIAVRLLPLIRKRLHIDHVELRRPAIELVQASDGRWNFSTLGSSGKDGGGSSTAGSGAALFIGEFRVVDGNLAVSEAGSTRTVYENINISLRDFGPGRRFQAELSAALPDKGGSVILEASGDPLDSPRPKVAGHIQIREAQIGALRKFMKAHAVQADGVLGGEIALEWQDPVLRARPNLAIDRLKVEERDVAGKIQIAGDLSHNRESGVLQITEGRLTAGNVPLAISGTVDLRQSNLDVTLRTNRAPLGEILAVAAAFGAAPVAGSGTLTLDARVRGRLGDLSALDVLGGGSLRDASMRLPSLTQPLRVRSADLKLAGKEAAIEGLACSLGGSNLRGRMSVRNFVAPAADFNLDIDTLDVAEIQGMVKNAPAKQKAAATPKSKFQAKGRLGVGTLSVNQLVFKQVRSECTFSDSVLTLAPMSAQVFGGAQSGGITVDMRTEPMSITANTKLDSVDANQLLSATTSLKQVLFGMLAASGQASMKMAPGAAAARSLNGDLSLKLTKGRLGGINVMNELASVGKFIGASGGGQPFTNILGLSGDVQVRDGVARTENLALQLDGASLAAAGAVNLVDESLNLRMTAVLGRDSTQKVGGSKIGGYLSTALINNQGELVIPAVVTGTFAKPRFTPDAARFAEMKLKTVLPSAASVVDVVKGKAAAGSLLDALRGKKPEAAAPQPASAPTAEPKRNGLFDALKSIQKRAAQPEKQ